MGIIQAPEAYMGKMVPGMYSARMPSCICYAVGYFRRYRKLRQFPVAHTVNTELLKNSVVPTLSFGPADYTSKAFGMFDDHVKSSFCCNRPMIRAENPMPR